MPDEGTTKLNNEDVGPTPIKNLLKKHVILTEKKYERKSVAEQDTIPTGYEKLDDILGQIRRGSLYVIAGRPGMGKTALVSGIAKYAATERKELVLYLSLLETGLQLCTKFLSDYAKVNSQRIDKGFLAETDWPRLIASASLLGEASLWVDDRPFPWTTMDERMRIFQAYTGEVPGLLIVDSLQMITPGAQKYDSRSHELSIYLAGLKSWAKEMDASVIVTSGLNRSVEDRSNRRPLLSDLRDSGAIEDIADVVIFVYRDEVYNWHDDNPERGIAEIIVAKNRLGPTGMFKLAFLERFNCFENLAQA